MKRCLAAVLGGLNIVCTQPDTTHSYHAVPKRNSSMASKGMTVPVMHPREH